jgi:hypothetical protein
MGKSGGRSAEEVEKVVIEFERSGLSRREYSEQRGIPLPTLDWYRRRVQTRRGATNGVTKLARVRVKAPATSVAATGAARDGFALSLVNGCRIEAGWNFDESRLAQLIRIAGAA